MSAKVYLHSLIYIKHKYSMRTYSMHTAYTYRSYEKKFDKKMSCLHGGILHRDLLLRGSSRQLHKLLRLAL